MKDRLCIFHKWGDVEIIEPNFLYKKCKKCGHVKPVYKMFAIKGRRQED